LSREYKRQVRALLGNKRLKPDTRARLEFEYLYSWKRKGPPEWVETYATIKDKKTGKLIVFKQNKPQKILARDLYPALRGETKWRPIILKSRQWGISTWFVATQFEAMVNVPNLACGICADKSERAATMRSKLDLALKHLPYQEYLSVDNRDQTKLQRNGSSIAFTSAEGGNPFRGDTLRFVHCTETAFWKDVDKALTALNQAVPDVPGTVRGHESTANGLGNPFHQMWLEAEKREGDMTPYFFPWWMDPEFDFMRPVTEAERSEILATQDEEELFLLDNDVLPEQLAWRRGAIRDLCLGDVDKFHQEYPSTPEEAFLKPGRSLFAPALIMRHRANCEAGRVLDVQPRDFSESLGRLRYDVVENARGRLTVWERFNPRKNYVVTCDSAEGVGQDNGVIQVLQADTREQVAEWADNMTQPYETGRIMACIGHMYGTAFAWPEVNSPGSAVIQALRDCQYPMIGARPSFNQRSTIVQGEFGWRSDSKNRPLVMNELRNNLRHNTVTIRSEACLLEAASMYVDRTAAGNDTYKYPKGGKIDRVDSLAVAVYACRFVTDYDIFEDAAKNRKLTYDERSWEQYERSVQKEPESELVYLDDDSSPLWDRKDQEDYPL
jgi:hypothetical protein